MTSFKLTLLSILQAFLLIAGISLIASVSPEFPLTEYWARVIVGAAGITLVLAGLTCRDTLGRSAGKPNQRPRGRGRNERP